MKTSFFKRATVGALLLAVAAPAFAATQLTGAGSSFVNPFFSKAFYDYGKMHSDVAVNYQSIGSGGGIQQFTAKNIDFGASDVPMTAEELKRAGDAVIQIPVALGGVSVAYNVPGIPNGLRLTRQNVVDLFYGKITKWNDKALQKNNPHDRLPDVPVVVVHRSDGSGTNYIFTDFLSSVSGEWKSKVGTGKSVQWPAPSSVGGKGNEGVAGQIRNTPGAIGYVELAYAIENHMNAAALQNVSGKWVSDSIDTVRAASATKPNLTATDFSIVNRRGDRAYPIAGYTWVMVYEEPKDRGRGKMTHDVLKWIVEADAQKMAGTLDYVPLPANVSRTAQAALSRMKV